MKQFGKIKWWYIHIFCQKLNCLIFQIIYAETDIVTSGKKSPEEIKISYVIPNYFNDYPAHGNTALNQDFYLGPFLDYDGNGFYTKIYSESKFLFIIIYRLLLTIIYSKEDFSKKLLN